MRRKIHSSASEHNIIREKQIQIKQVYSQLVKRCLQNILYF